MESRKLTSADIDKVRDIEGFPNATDEAIINLSDAPYYTACPNPFIGYSLRNMGLRMMRRLMTIRGNPFPLMCLKVKAIPSIWLTATIRKYRIGRYVNTFFITQNPEISS